MNDGWSGGDRWAFAGLLFAAACLRLWAVLALHDEPRIRMLILDGKHYFQVATEAAASDWPAGPIFMTPLYPWILSVLFRAFGPSVLVVQVFQAVLGIAALALMVMAARRDLGRTAAWIAGGLYLLSGPVLAMESQVLTETLLLFLTALALWLWPRVSSFRDGSGTRGALARGPEFRRALFFGVACGALVVGRGVFLLLPLAAIASLYLGMNRRVPGVGTRGGEKRTAPRGTARWAQAGLIAAGCMAAVAPLAVHQTRATGHLQLLTLNGGLNLYIGNNPSARGIYSQPPEVNIEGDLPAIRSASILAGRDLDLVGASRYWTRRTLDSALERPLRLLWLLGRKALLFLAPHEVPQVEDFQILRRLHLPLRVAVIDFRWIAPLAALGVAAAWAGWRRSRRRPGTGGSEAGDGRATDGTPPPPAISPWLLVIVVGWISTIVFFATGRYRIPIWPAFLGLAGYGGAVVWEMIRERRLRASLLAAPIAAGVMMIAPGYAAQKARVHDLYQLGLRWSEAGEPERALQAWEEAAKLDPASGEAWHGVGVALVGLGRLDEAIRAYQQALRFLPGSAVTHYNLGAVQGRLGRDDLALQEFSDAVRLDPFDPRFRSDLGVALARTGRVEEAIEQFRTVLRRNPEYEPARRHLQALTGGSL